MLDIGNKYCLHHIEFTLHVEVSVATSIVVGILFDVTFLKWASGYVHLYLQNNDG